MRTIAYRRVIDLSHPIHSNMPLWIGDPAVEFEVAANLERDGYYLRRFSMGEHSGTHINAPRSFSAEGIGVDGYAPESLVLPTVVIDVRAEAEANADYCLSERDVLDWEQQYGKIPAGSMVLLYTGWQLRWNNPEAFLNLDNQGVLHFPGFSGEVTQFLLAERAIAGVGIDTHGVDSGQDITFATNRQILLNRGIVLENLTNLDLLPAVGTTLAIGILRLQNGSGSPASVLAFIP